MITADNNNLACKAYDCMKAADLQTDDFMIPGKTAAMLAHEMKTPLTSIKMNVDMLCEDISLPEHKKKSLVIIQKEIARLSKLINSFLQFSVQHEPVLTRVNLRELVEEVGALLSPVLENAGIKLINEIGDYKIFADHDQMKSVFINLISNSVDAIGVNGIIETISHFDIQKKTFSILIKDNGKGIEEKEKIFDPFFTTRNCGTGLGLPIALEIIRNHNGFLKLISSKPGETIFEISFSI